MTALGGKVPSQYSGDMITCTNQGQGLTNTIQQIQDGKGNPSAIGLSLIEMKMKTNTKFTGAAGSTVVATNGLIGIPMLAGDPTAPSDALFPTAYLYWNSADEELRLWDGTDWRTFEPD